MSNPILFKLTDAGKNALLDDANTGLTLRLTHVGIGQGKYTPTSDKTALDSEISRHTITAGGIEPASHTLRFSTTLYADTETEVWEIGVFDENNILFAVASRTDKPLLKVYPDVAFVGSFGLTVDALDISHVQVVADPNGAMAVALMQQHLAHADPHPQYALRSLLDEVSNTVIKKLQQQVEQLKIPIGGLFATTKHYANGEAVTAELGYGKWMRALIGRTGVGFNPNASDWTATMGQQYGENEHTLTVDEMPSHTHDWLHGQEQDDQSYGNSHNEFTFATGTIKGAEVIGETGGNKPHNNVQPSQVIGYWVRIPDDYVPPTYRVYWTSDEQGINQTNQINEGEKAFLWVEVANLITPQPIGGVINGDKQSSISIAGGRFDFPPTLDNGKTKLGEYTPTDIAQDLTISIGISLPDDEQVLAELTVKNDVGNDVAFNLLIQYLDKIEDHYGWSVRSSSIQLETNNPSVQLVEFKNGQRKATKAYYQSAYVDDIAGKAQQLYAIWIKIPSSINFEMFNAKVNIGETIFDGAISFNRKTGDIYQVRFVNTSYQGAYANMLSDNDKNHNRWIVIEPKETLINNIPIELTTINSVALHTNINVNLISK